MYVYTVEGDPPLHFGRAPSSDCQPLVCSLCEPYQNRRLAAPSNTTFVAQIGPSAAQRGYMGITGEADPLVRTLINISMFSGFQMCGTLAIVSEWCTHSVESLLSCGSNAQYRCQIS